MSKFSIYDQFEKRHIGPKGQELNEMLQVVGASSLDELINETVPANIRLKTELQLPEAISEYKFLRKIKSLASKNKVFKSHIGMGYHDTITPGVILRNVLENPAWYTAYTPYQAEIAQGRLEALINFQTVVTELTGMTIANASLLDEATAAAEAMTMLFHTKKGKKKTANTFIIANTCHPQTIDVLKTRATPIGIELKIVSEDELEQSLDDNVYGTLLQYPNTDGAIVDYEAFITNCHNTDIKVVLATDLLSLTLLTSPGKLGADVVVGSSQRFGVPMGYGGPHAGFFATNDSFKRQLPGRIIGATKDTHGNLAYRMALQTREQHIRREKATSNICTAQVLLAVIASFYAVYHGPKGLKAIAERIHNIANSLNDALSALELNQVNDQFFDTLKVEFENTDLLRSIAENEEINFRYYEGAVGIAIDETTSSNDLANIINVFKKALNKSTEPIAIKEVESCISGNLIRKDTFMEQEVFHKYDSEHEMLRYIKRLENKDLSMVHSMISLGSCTMKLNATAEMIPVTWPEFGKLHPFVPREQASGYRELFKRLNQWLCEITGFTGMSFQPNSGAQGEYAGLLVIKTYHESRGDLNRKIALIPSSAHGTNPASAVMVGMKVVVVACDEKGNIDVEDLKLKASEHKDELAALMVTYPSTHGVFEESIIEICDIIHQAGGQVYMDGANMNAQVGLTSPFNIGADVCHLNLHKTFCIPHGGGGPGVGPIGVAEHLVPFLPGHSVVEMDVESTHTSAVSAAPWGSASILPISYAYMMMMGGEGLKNATMNAILNANYILKRLENHYDILYTGANGRCAHEMIVDFRKFKQDLNIEVEDIAKRLMDYGFHAPTVSFPVAGTLMIEPTESETKEELDRFCDALISIRQEINEVDPSNPDNVLKNAPHTVGVVTADDWNYGYSRSKAAYPLEWIRERKFWPSVGRINNALGDRNLVCTCGTPDDYA